MNINDELVARISSALIRQVGDTRSCPICMSAAVPRDSTAQLALEAYKDLERAIDQNSVPRDERSIETDAARYRFLRESQHFGGMEKYKLEWYLPRNVGGDLRDQLDNAIDSEIKRLKL